MITQLHYPDGTPYHPQDALDAFATRMKVADGLASCLHAYPHANAGEVAAYALFALANDFEELHAVVNEWFDRLEGPPWPDVGGWGTDEPLRPRRKRQDPAEAEVAS